MTTKLYFKTVDGRYISLDNNVKDMQKARVTKYIKRVPKPSGKGYYYFYTKAQFNQYKKDGKVPEQSKETTALQKIFKFLGVDNWMDGSKKIGQIYESNKTSLLENNVDKKTFAEYSIEYLQNKEKWDKKLSGQKKEKGESKPKSKTQKSEKKESGEKKEGKWNVNVMRTIAGIYGGGEKKESESKYSEKKVFSDGDNEIYEVTINGKKRYEVPDKNTGTRAILDTLEEAKEEIEANKRIEKYRIEQKKEQETKAETEKNKYNILGSWGETLSNREKALAVKQLEKQFKSPTGKIRSAKDVIDEKIAEGWKVHKDEDGKESFRHPDGVRSFGGTMGNSTITKYAVHRFKEMQKESPDNFETMPDKLDTSKLGKVVGSQIGDTGTDYVFNVNSEDNKKSIIKTLNRIEGTNYSEKDVTWHKGKFITNDMKYFTGEGDKGGYSFWNKIKEPDQKPSATEAKEIERTERFPEYATYAEVPEGFTKVEGTTAPKGYEFYRNGSPLSKDYKQVLVKDKPSATEALKTFTIVDNNNPERTVKVQAKDENEAKDKGASELKTTNIRTYESSSKVEALKEELGKKKSEGKEREITVFGKQQKVKTKPIELNLGYEHPFEIAKRDFGNNRSDWIILESNTGLKVGDGKTQKDAIENAETMIKKYTKSESEFKQLVEKNNPENIEKKDNKPEQEARKQVEKDFEDKTPKGQASIKRMEDENRKKKNIEENLKSKDPQKKYDAMKEEIRDFAERNNISEKEITKEWIEEERKRFKEDIKDAYKYKKPKEAGVYKAGLKELDNIEKYQKEMISLKEELLGPKMFKALSNLREELMFKAQTTKYIKRIPDPKGKGYIYFYTPEQVKAYQKDGTIPNQQKKPEVKPEQGGKTNIEKLKETTKKIATIVADALSAKDAVQPAGSAVEQAGEDINEKNKMKKRLEEKQVPDKKKPVNKPEEKPKK